MNVGDLLRFRGLLAAAIGAGMMVGAAGIFLYHQFFAERRRAMLQRELARLDVTVAEMKNELASLRKKNCCKHGPAKHYKSFSSFSDVDTELDMHSAIDGQSGVDTDDLDEFFDFSDDDDVLLLNDSDVPKRTEGDPKLTQLFSNVDQLLKGDLEDRKSAYSLLKEYEEQFPDSVDLLWRLAKASHGIATAGEVVDDKMKKEYILEGCSYSQKALEMDDSNCEAHKWFAITVGSRGEFMSMREKIVDGFVFKQHVDKALTINPSDPLLHHLSGRFKYEVASLTWIERTVAKSLYGEIASASFPEAITDFLQAEELSTGPWKENELLLAKCYINQGDTCSAISWLKKAAETPATLPEEEAADKEIQTLLAKHCDDGCT